MADPSPSPPRRQLLDYVPPGVCPWLERISPRQRLVLALILVVLILAAALHAIGRSTPRIDVPRDWYTTDDGRTWFKDLHYKYPPFKHDGKEAVRAYVYRCPGSKPFVGSLMRYSPRVIQEIEAANQGKPLSDELKGGVSPDDIWYKRPGDKEWIKRSTPREELAKRFLFTCPDGSTPQPVQP